MHLVSMATVASLLMTAAACQLQDAQAAPPPDKVEVATATCDPGKVCVTASWPVARDAAGSADHYKVQAAGLGVSLDTVVTGTQLRLKLPCTPGVSGDLTVHVWSVRRDSVSKTSATAKKTLTCLDAPPPAPDSISIVTDTLARVDSTAVDSVLISPSTVTVASGDSVRVTAYKIDLTGRKTPAIDPTWAVETGSQYVRLNPVKGTADAWVVGLECSTCTTGFRQTKTTISFGV